MNESNAVKSIKSKQLDNFDDKTLLIQLSMFLSKKKLTKPEIIFASSLIEKVRKRGLYEESDIVGFRDFLKEKDEHEKGYEENDPYQMIIGKEKCLVKAIELANKFSKGPWSVLISGETGSGKELFAKAIYYFGDRSDKPFISLNCGTLPENLIENELFGHEKGAFTGAATKKIGLIEEAAGGVLFLDEIDALPLHAQQKLLRALEEKKIRTVGGNKEIIVDIKIVAATNKHLEKEIELGTFREDLFFRLNTLNLFIPPLRERKRDIVLLIDHFLDEIKKQDKTLSHLDIDGDAIKKLVKYHWPGNVRELRNSLIKAAICSDGRLIRPENIELVKLDKPEILQGNKIKIELTTFKETTQNFQKSLVLYVLKLTAGNQARAGKILGFKTGIYISKLRKKFSITDQDIIDFDIDMATAELRFDLKDLRGSKGTTTLSEKDVQIMELQKSLENARKILTETKLKHRSTLLHLERAYDKISILTKEHTSITELAKRYFAMLKSEGYRDQDLIV